MSILKRSMMTVAAVGAAGAIAAGGYVPALAATTSGVRYRQLFVSASWLGPGHSGEEDECSMLLLSAADSDGSPAYVSGLLQSSTSDPCTGWLQDSVNGGAWTDVSPQQTLPGTTQGLVNYPWAKTADYYAGPGTSVRACVLTPALPGFPSEAKCSSSSVTLPASTAAAPTSDGTSVLYAHNNQTANVSGGGGRCSVFLSSSGTLAKTAASQASMTIIGTMTCTAWLETSADNGATWVQATPTYSLPFTNPATDWAFSPAVADGTGELARACEQFGTGRQGMHRGLVDTGRQPARVAARAVSLPGRPSRPALVNEEMSAGSVMMTVPADVSRASRCVRFWAGMPPVSWQVP